MGITWDRRELVETHTKRVLELLKRHKVELEIGTTEQSFQTSLSNIAAVNRGTQQGIVHSRVREGYHEGPIKNEIVYARQIVIPGKDDASIMRTCADLVRPIHHCAQKLGLQGAIDYDGRTFGRNPMMTFGGYYEVGKIDEILELMTTVDNLIGFYLK